MPEYFFVYPAYLDRRLSRADGRRVPAPEATPDVTAEELVKAAERLGWKAELESGKQYPRRFYSYAGRVKIAKKGSRTKAAALRSLAGELQKLRAQAGKN
jgi:signal recognition particle subunit SRP19